MTRVAALFVEETGPYASLPGVDAWGIGRDARAYRGPHPVVAHPPCKRWGRYWGGGPSARRRRILGDDEGCFAAALWSVRSFGGVLEHPEASHAWAWFGLERPAFHGGWTEPDRFGGRSCCVSQGHYGHRARKATWLYMVGHPSPPALVWGPAQGERLEPGFHSREERASASEAQRLIPRLTARERLWTPEPFRDLLLGLARECA